MSGPSPAAVRSAMLDLAAELFGIDAAAELASRLARENDRRFRSAITRAGLTFTPPVDNS